MSSNGHSPSFFRNRWQVLGAQNSLNDENHFFHCFASLFRCLFLDQSPAFWFVEDQQVHGIFPIGFLFDVSSVWSSVSGIRTSVNFDNACVSVGCASQANCSRIFSALMGSVLQLLSRPFILTCVLQVVV